MNLPEFIEAGAAFFRGETVPKASLTAAQGEADRFKRVLDLQTEEANRLTGQLAVVADQNAALQTELATTKAALAASQLNAATLADKAVSAPRAAANILAAAGVDPVASQLAPAEPGSKTFESLVAEKIAAGKPKSVAVSEAIKEFPAAYDAWMAKGGSRL